jgi:hypothetical protein
MTLPLCTRVRCRQIERTDLDAIANLLVRGFPATVKSYWVNALKTLDNHPAPEGYPKFGYLIENEGAAAGVLLLIYTSNRNGSPGSVRCNVSSWYVDPMFRNFAPLLVSRAVKHQPATYVNVSASPHTWPIVEAQGFTRFSSGTFVTVPALIPRFGTAKITEFDNAQYFRDRLSTDDFNLLHDHHSYGCLSLLCETSETAYPLIFRRRRIKGRLFPAAQLIYCPSTESLVKCGGTLGRYLLRRGMPLLLTGATGPLPLLGKYFHDKWPMYYHGKDRPRFLDIAYTEAALFGT